MRKKLFTKAKELDALIDLYFKTIEDEKPVEKNTAKSKVSASAIKNVKSKKDEPGPFTLAGLSFHLGFNSIQEFEEYELNGKFAGRLKRARLRIEDLYEKRLHTQYTSGAIFALKSLGWNDRVENKPVEDATNFVLKIEIVQAGPQLAGSEKEVVL